MFINSANMPHLHPSATSLYCSRFDGSFFSPKITNSTFEMKQVHFETGKLRVFHFFTEKWCLVN